MTTAAHLRNHYTRDAVTTASPGKLLVMLYDRLLKDLTVAEGAVAARDVRGAHEALVHAQDIVRELAATMDTSIWSQGTAVLRLYDYVLDQLVQANVTKDATHIHAAREVMAPLRDAWAEAAAKVAA